MTPMKKKLTALATLFAAVAALAAWQHRSGTPVEDAATAALGALASAGADLNLKDKLGRTPLHYAVLPQESQPAECGGRTPMHQLAIRQRGDAAFVAALIDQGANVNAQDLDGNTPLHFAAIENDPRAGGAMSGLVPPNPALPDSI